MSFDEGAGSRGSVLESADSKTGKELAAGRDYARGNYNWNWKEGEKMRGYIYRHEGVYLPGISIVIARDEEEAEKELTKMLEKSYLHTGQDLEIEKIDEISLNAPLAKIVFNGDY
jgi:hypothetical protein